MVQKAATELQNAPTGVAGRAPLTIAIVGFGTVGRSVAKVLSSGIHPSLRLAMVCNRGVERKKVDWVPGGVEWTDSSPASILAFNSSTVICCIVYNYNGKGVSVLSLGGLST